MVKNDILNYMWNMNEVTKIKYKNNYIFRIVFDDGTNGDVDFSGYIGKVPTQRNQRLYEEEGL